MALILSIESATKNCSVALAADGEVITLKELREEKFSHAEKLHSFILEVMDSSDRNLDELDAIAVSKGPGSYTGLRIGVSAAKGLCYALDKPLISVPTLESLARQVEMTDEGVIVPLLDARRMEVYSAVYNDRFEEIRETRAEIIDASSFSEYLDKNRVCFLGDGAAKTKETINHPNAVFIMGRFPSAREMARIAEQKAVSQQFEDLAYFEPFYLKDFVAGKPKRYF
jgi:tRNA threonylcarbamoyladenosine biosynthesis protein TsaB